MVKEPERLATMARSGSGVSCNGRNGANASAGRSRRRATRPAGRAIRIGGCDTQCPKVTDSAGARATREFAQFFQLGPPLARSLRSEPPPRAIVSVADVRLWPIASGLTFAERF
jgi:hypothetical protein